MQLQFDSSPGSVDPDSFLTPVELHNKRVLPLPPRRREVRDYDIDPVRVVDSIRRALEQSDLDRLPKAARDFLDLYMSVRVRTPSIDNGPAYDGSLAEFARSVSVGGQGYEDDHLLRYWIAEPTSYLHDATYRGVEVAEIARQVADLARYHLPRLQAESEAKVRLADARQIQALARAHGFTPEKLAELLGHDEANSPASVG